jgi:asparagine synthase (glutamine-hydrolysing)
MVEGDKLRIARYWDFRHIAVDQSWLSRTDDDLADELDDLVKRAVRLRLISDVPLGAFLSGGVDSGLVAAEMRAAGFKKPKTFTISFKEPNYDEGPAAAETARHLGVEHVVETLSVDHLLELLPACVDAFDEPVADSSAFPTLAVARLARRHVTVALTGDGADELFGGYHYYPLAERLARMGSVPHVAKSAARGLLGRLPIHNAKLLSHALQFDDRVELFQYLRSFSKDFAPLASHDLLASTTSSAARFAMAAGCFPLELTASEIGMRLDSRFTLADDYLQKVDVATMAYSLEARCPFLDYRVVEWAMRLPLQFKVRDGETKVLLKRVLSRHLPQNLVYKPKRGFGVPVALWLRGPLRGWAQDLLHDRSLTGALPLDREQLLRIFNLHVSGKRDAHPILWSALMLLCFVAHHVQRRSLPEFLRSNAA